MVSTYDVTIVSTCDFNMINVIYDFTLISMTSIWFI